mmetsp:Transcript_16991/g.53294  ORF Transcript_16991/g.53294 Transcript_16991/m.53294 type:complete len:176 (-) Transcript_16991:67-594(-)
MRMMKCPHGTPGRALTACNATGCAGATSSWMPRVCPSRGALHASKWTVVHLSHVLALPLAQTETIGGICVALCTSVLACLMVFGINWICDQRQLHEVMRKQFRTIIRCLGLLIGFAWEQSFDSGVEAVAMLAEPMGTWPPLLAKFFLACVVAVVVIPAWKLHILKTVMAVRSQGS